MIISPSRKKLKINKSIVNEFYPKSVIDLELILRTNIKTRPDLAKEVAEVYIIKCIDGDYGYAASQERLVELGFNENEAANIFTSTRKKLRYLEDQKLNNLNISRGITLIAIGGALSFLYLEFDTLLS